MENYDLIQLLLKLPMEMEVALSTKSILDDDSDEKFHPEPVKDVYVLETDNKETIAIIQS